MKIKNDAAAHKSTLPFVRAVFHVSGANSGYDYIGTPLDGCGPSWNSMSYIYRDLAANICYIVIFPQEGTYYCPINLWK